MHAALAVQYLLIACAVLASAWIVMKKQFPHATRRVCVALATPMVRDGRPAWLRALGRRLAPPRGGGDGCGGCDNCGPAGR
jgi:hypothetical protein